jgi:asparagine synthase (glutamine-hydrolysing)
MCGILGAIPAVQPETFLRALTTIAHRGPDGQGVWQDEARVMLGHRRLSILDITDAAAQPMHRHGRYHIVFNGEIYNFLEIRRELEKTGERFQSESDTEVLLAAYARWGKDCLARLNGMWALAVWDSQEQHLFLARDRLGEKPLFYLNDGRRFIFASEQKALLPFMREVRAAEHFHSLCSNPYAYEGTGESLFNGISRFPAAHYGSYKDGKLRVQRYWAPLESVQQVPVGYDEQVEALRELLLDSCKLRLRADVPVATGLSGGVDSSAVAASIAEVGRQRGVERLPTDWQNAFVASFPGTVMDEAAAAKRIASHLGITLREIPVVPDGAAEDLERIAYLFEEVHEVNPLPHCQLYREMRKQGVLVSLDGHGGDELFCGYESSILHALPSTLFAPEDARMVLSTYSAVHPPNAQFLGMPPWRIGAYLVRSEMRDRQKKWLRDSRMQRAAAQCDSLNRHLLSLSFETVLPTLLRNYDRYSMLSGVEIRCPLLDHRIVDFAFALTWKSKLRNGYTKAILRDAVAQWLPEGIVTNRTKIGFAPPIIDWMRGPLKKYLLDEIETRQFRESTMISARDLKKSIIQIISGQKMTLYAAEKVWKNYSIYLWEKAFLTGGNQIRDGK